MKALETKRLLLERWNDQRREAWQSICRDREVMRYIGRAELWDSAKANDVFDGMLAHWREDDFGWRSVLERESGQWLGFVGLNVVGPGVEGVAPEEVEIGWWLVRSAWGRGYASEGASAARDEGFERLGLPQMIARLQPANLASSRVAEKMGMSLTRKGTGRHGEPLHIYGLDRADWKRRLRSGEKEEPRRRRFTQARAMGCASALTPDAETAPQPNQIRELRARETRA